MLQRITIHNIALISELELDFCDNLNILSGETGAGKSIIVDSLMLLFGDRFDKTLLKFGEKSGLVEGLFSCDQPQLLEEIGLDADTSILISRKFLSEGKNEIRVNGRTVTIGMLKQLSAGLVDIYGQNDYQNFSKIEKHLQVLDNYVRHNIENLLIVLDRSVTEYKALRKQIEAIGDVAQRERTIDMLRFQITDIESAAVQENEEEELVEQRKIMLSGEKIRNAMQSLLQSLRNDSGTPGAEESLDDAIRSAGSVAPLRDVYEDLYSRLESVRAELSDIADCAESELDSLNFEPNALDALEKRLETIRLIKKKYGNYAEMQRFYQDALEKCNTLEHAEERYEQLLKQKERIVSDIYALSKQLSDQRRKGAKEFEQKIVQEISELGMQHSRFEVVFEDFPLQKDCEALIGRNGMDNAEFYLSPNPGQPLLPLLKIISGGEMSRFMLALKVVSSDAGTIPTMIFDEIDAGISGKVGQEVAKKLARLSRRHQVICVTHLPQIAAMADNHYYIKKIVEDHQTRVCVELLKSKGMLEEISRLTGGQDISKQAVANAGEMKQWSIEYKQSIPMK